MCKKSGGWLFFLIFFCGTIVGYNWPYVERLFDFSLDSKIPLSLRGDYYLQADNIYYERAAFTKIESMVFAYQVKGNRLYIYGSSGYTIVDMISGKAKKYPQNYYTGAEGKAALDEIYFSKIVIPWGNNPENSTFKDGLIYLDSWSEWTEEEQKILAELKINGKEKYERILVIKAGNFIKPLQPVNVSEEMLGTKKHYKIENSALKDNEKHGEKIEPYIFSFEKAGNILYVYGVNGYTVVDLENGNLKEKFVNLYTEEMGIKDTEGRIFPFLSAMKLKREKNKEYVRREDSFTDEEQEVFERLKEAGATEKEHFKQECLRRYNFLFTDSVQ